VTFTGFPDAAFAFYEGLAADNSKAYWTAHKGTYDDAVRGPMLDLLAGLEEEFGAGHTFRPYRDVRFARDKTPYKDHQGGYVEAGDAVGYYIQLSADGLMVAGGWYSPQGQQVQRYREVVAGPAGAELQRLLTQVTDAGFEVGGDRLKTRPRGVDADHPRIDLLRHRSVVASRTHPPRGWVHTAKALDRVREGWDTLRPLVTWLADHVGPGEPSPPGRS